MHQGINISEQDKQPRGNRTQNVTCSGRMHGADIYFACWAAAFFVPTKWPKLKPQHANTRKIMVTLLRYTAPITRSLPMAGNYQAVKRPVCLTRQGSITESRHRTYSSNVPQRIYIRQSHCSAIVPRRGRMARYHNAEQVGGSRALQEEVNKQPFLLGGFRHKAV